MWNSAQYVEAEQNKYYERKKGRNYISRQACFVNRFTLQGFNVLGFCKKSYMLNPDDYNLI